MRVGNLSARQVVIVPTSHVDTYLAVGWRLTDEPHCSGACKSPPGRALLERVPNAKSPTRAQEFSE